MEEAGREAVGCGAADMWVVAASVVDSTAEEAHTLLASAVAHIHSVDTARPRIASVSGRPGDRQTRRLLLDGRTGAVVDAVLVDSRSALEVARWHMRMVSSPAEATHSLATPVEAARDEARNCPLVDSDIQAVLEPDHAETDWDRLRPGQTNQGLAVDHSKGFWSREACSLEQADHHAADRLL